MGLMILYKNSNLKKKIKKFSFHLVIFKIVGYDCGIKINYFKKKVKF